MTATHGLKSASLHVRDLRTRLPSRYGVVLLTRFPPLLAMESAT